MKISLFSQSLRRLGLQDAIRSTAAIGYEAIELFCYKPHFDLATAQRDPQEVADCIRSTGLQVSALSLVNNLTDRGSLTAEIDSAATFIRLAPLFHTATVKMTPGPPPATTIPLVF